MQKNMATRNNLLLPCQGRTLQCNSTPFRTKTDTEPCHKWQPYPGTHMNTKGSTKKFPITRRQWPMLAQTKKLPHCNQKNMKYRKLHKILECKQHQGKRTHIFESILTEHCYLKKKFYGSTHDDKQIMPREQHNLILDASITGSVHKIQSQQQIAWTMVGNVDESLKDEAQQQMAWTMVAHLYLLINIFTNNIQTVTKWTKTP